MKKTFIAGGVSKSFKTIAQEIISADYSVKEQTAFMLNSWKRSGLKMSFRIYASHIYKELMFLTLD